MDPRKIKLSGAGDVEREDINETGDTTVADAAADTEKTAAEAVTEPEEAIEDELPVLIPDDYDVEDIDYSVRNTMSDVVAAKEDIKEATPYKRPKLRGKEAFENFMYHHKTELIVGVVAIIMLVIVIIQSIPEKYDNYVNIYANVKLGGYSLTEIQAQITEHAVDVDGNGEVRINLGSYNRNGISDPYESMVAYMFIESEFGGKFNSFLVIVDKDHYDFIVENVGEDIFEAYEDYPVLISLKNSTFVTPISESNANTEELFLALVSVPDRFRDDEDMVARQQAAKELMGRILEAYPELAETKTAQ